MKSAEQLNMVAGHIKRDFDRAEKLYEKNKEVIDIMNEECEKRASLGTFYYRFEAKGLLKHNVADFSELAEYFEIMGFAVRVYMVNDREQAVEIRW